MSSSQSEAGERGLMGGSVVCSSGLSESDTALLRSIVTQLGGRYVANLSQTVTQLVVGTTGSEKFKTASRIGIPCVDLDWVLEVQRQKRLLATSDFLKDAYFEGIVVCLTGGAAEERLELRRLVERGGGKFSTKMVGGLCTHLVADEPGGGKWDLAKEFPSTRIVSKQWVLDCSQRKELLPEDDYPVAEAKEGLESPTGGAASTAGRCWEPANSAAALEQTLCEYDRLVGREDGRGTPLGSGVFTNEVFFLAGFSPEIKDRLLGMIYRGGGQRHVVFDSAVTRVLLGENIDVETLQIVRSSRAKCMQARWVLKRLRSEGLGGSARRPGEVS